MGWEASDRRDHLPTDWRERRAQVLARAGGRCEAVLHDTGTRCPSPATDCDHVQRGDNHALENLQALCSWHHKRKTRLEAIQAMDELNAARAPRQRPHPGLIDP